MWTKLTFQDFQTLIMSRDESRIFQNTIDPFLYPESILFTSYKKTSNSTFPSYSFQLTNLIHIKC